MNASLTESIFAFAMLFRFLSQIFEVQATVPLSKEEMKKSCLWRKAKLPSPKRIDMYVNEQTPTSFYGPFERLDQCSILFRSRLFV